MILISPNAFRNCLSAQQVSESIEKGILSVSKKLKLMSLPMADGGDGTLKVLQPFFQADEISVPARNALGQELKSKFLLSQDRRTAIIEMAEVCGLKTIPNDNLDPINASSWGVGDLIRSALDYKIKKIILGVGGSASIDGGAGALEALGVRFLDNRGKKLNPTPNDLIHVSSIDTSEIDSRLKNIKIKILSDVNTPLFLNPSTFGTQKGLKKSDFLTFQKMLVNLTSHFPISKTSCLHIPWLGAGGGIGAGLVEFFGAEALCGVRYIAKMLKLEQLIKKSRCVITGEGKLDESSSYGKAPLYLANLASLYNVKSYIICGQVEKNFQLNDPLINIINLKTKYLSNYNMLDYSRENIFCVSKKIASEYIEKEMQK